MSRAWSLPSETSASSARSASITSSAVATLLAAIVPPRFRRRAPPENAAVYQTPTPARRRFGRGAARRQRRGRRTPGRWRRMARTVAAPSQTTRTEIVPFRPDLLDVVARFSAEVWQRPRSPGFLRWRYLEHPHHHAVLALRGGHCLAMVSSFRRPYRIGERTVLVSDSFDWYCLPELRRAGLGVRVLQRLMQDPEPVIVTGGSADTRELLPRMRFQIPAIVQRYGLMLGAERAADALARRTRLPRAVGRLAFALSRPLLAPRVRGAPENARVEEPARLGEEALAIDPRAGRRGTAPVWTPEYLAWLAAGSPAFGRYLPLCFRVGDALVGWALLRIHESAGRRNAA